MTEAYVICKKHEENVFFFVIKSLTYLNISII